MEQVMCAYSDYIILPVLIQLSETRPVTANDVAEITGIPHRTVKRAVHRLLEKGEIVQIGQGRRWGYRYERTKR